MKNKYSILLIITSLFSSYSSLAQYTDVINNQINFEFKVVENWYGGGNDLDGQADPTIKTDFWLEGAGWFGWMCQTWDCSASCSNFDSWVWVAGAGYAFDTEYQITMQAFESDNSDECTYTSGDDHYFNGNATLRNNQVQIPIVYPSTDYRPCNWNNWIAANGSQWCFQQTGEWDQRWAETWRYSAGDESTNPLDFGNISSGQTKSDINANWAISTESGYNLQYTNTSGESSADVWYKFTVNEPSQVTISTDHGETDFDTYLRLYTVAGNFVTEDDDGGSSNSSVIATTLCAGTYLINAEGFSSYTGLFKISVGVNSASAPSIIDVASYGVSCPGYTDGVVSFNATGGVEPYDAQFNGSTAWNNIVYDLSEGTYSIGITDACGSTDSESVTVGVDDQETPIASCQTLVEINVSQGNTTTLDPILVDNGSTDNCGIDAYSVSPSTFDITNVGSNTVTLTVTDESGNSNTCTSTVYALNNTGIEEEQLAQQFQIFPNPTNGSFNVDLTGLFLERDARLSVIDAVGKTVVSRALTSQLTPVELHSAEPGIYLVQLLNNGIMATKRITITN